MNKKEMIVDIELLVDKSKIKKDSNVIPVILTDDTPMKRIDWDGTPYTLILSHDEDSVDLERKDILPILWNHNDNGLPLGAYEDVKLEGNKTIANAVFDEDDTFATTVLNKAKKGVIKSLSAGLKIFEKEVLRHEDGSITVTATLWQMFEGSFVSNPANPNARVSLSNQITEDKFQIQNEGENQMDIKEVMTFLSNASANDKEQIGNALGLNDEVTKLSNQVKTKDDTITQLENKVTSAATGEKTLLANAQSSVKDILTMVNSKTFKSVASEKKTEAMSAVVLSNDGSFDKINLENVLLKSALATSSPDSGNNNNGEDEYQEPNMKGSL